MSAQSARVRRLLAWFSLDDLNNDVSLADVKSFLGAAHDEHGFNDMEIDEVALRFAPGGFSRKHAIAKMDMEDLQSGGIARGYAKELYDYLGGRRTRALVGSDQTSGNVSSISDATAIAMAVAGAIDGSRDVAKLASGSDLLSVHHVRT
jgi:hypothetical protein